MRQNTPLNSGDRLQLRWWSDPRLVTCDTLTSRLLGAVAQEFDARIYVEVLLGTFVHEGMVLTRILQPGHDGAEDIQILKSRILAAITIGIRRTFEHDPRFGLSVLSEIASRALSPAVNDP